MTRHKHAQTGLVTPSPLDRWIDAMLRVFAMLVFHVVSTIQMCARRPVVNATRQMPNALPRMTGDTIQETHLAAQPRSPIALIVSSERSSRPSNHEGVLTTVSHTHHGSGPPVRIPREGGDPVLLKQEAREAPGIPLRLLDPRLRGECVLRKRAQYP